MDDATAAQRQRIDNACVCPHIDRDDARCATRFSISRLDQAFSVCFGSFHGCPMYHRINHELYRTSHAPSPHPLITITAHGSTVPLRPTGT